MTVRVRIAPSPTGNLHIGTARTAVFNWLFARHQGGQFILRIEDTDLERSRPEYTQNILDGLTWLGLNWDEGPFFQTQRFDLYKQAIQTLLDKGLAYRCYTSEAELEEMRAAQIARKEAPRYDKRHRNLTPEQQAAFEAEGRRPVIRFKIDDDREISWHDMVRGKIAWKSSDLGGDIVIARASETEPFGQPLYNLAVVLDDIDMKITHVIRGEDHIANTAKQILLYEAFGAAVPHFAHTPLILNKKGEKLSKRKGVTSIFDFKKLGYTPEAMVNYMTLLGWSPPDSTKEIFTLAEAAELFSFDRVNKAGAKFDWAKLDWINTQYLHAIPVPQLTDVLIPYWQAAGYQFDPVSDRAWLEQITALIGPSLVRLPVSDRAWLQEIMTAIGPDLAAAPDAIEMTRYFFTANVEFTEEGKAQLQQEAAKTALKAILDALDRHQPLTEAGTQEIIKQVTKEQNLKKGLVMRSLRAALTGDVHGPDLIQSWLLLHQRRVDRIRLQSAV
ncbi:glutamate--tRNA ligase [Planktothrix sp. FACHB-1355]|uniref:Glutamate--tRNA ligase n=1 Tax=Aerosakkonema funiforme FACHB-1375 TaxID=2949571 RepID=A0A926VHY5_9CYAN|nr:glutamate--tRNA ligase [Aerosakkonema funiforme]MBD2182954.1 glutamate--tRNA ligase [Aerosakkonema funiforme FACHB-1375]MBD3560413.1 glutamate--tRNA ligase [Planktothrix sp. FACHB-1355]